MSGPSNAEYYPNAKVSHEVETTADGSTVVAEHTLDYDRNGNRISDLSRVQNTDDHSRYPTRYSTYTYDPLDRLATVTKTDAGTTVSAESYTHDANNNVIAQSIDGTTTTYAYNRNRLSSSTSGGVTAGYNYDPYGRLDTITAAGAVLQRLTYDGFDRTTRQVTNDGGESTTTDYTYDPLDRTTSRTDNPGTPEEKTTDYAYLGLSGQLLDERVEDELTKTYQYTPGGQRLSQTEHHLDGTTEDSYYGYDPHSDVEQLTGDDGDTKATYG